MGWMGLKSSIDSGKDIMQHPLCWQSAGHAGLSPQPRQEPRAAMLDRVEYIWDVMMAKRRDP